MCYQFNISIKRLNIIDYLKPHSTAFLDLKNKIEPEASQWPGLGQEGLILVRNVKKSAHSTIYNGFFQQHDNFLNVFNERMNPGSEGQKTIISENIAFFISCSFLLSGRCTSHFKQNTFLTSSIFSGILT